MKAVCPGTFDPMTLGHLDVVQRAQRLFGEVVVAVGTNSTKSPLFSLEERVELARASTDHLPGVSVEPIDGLLVDFCRERDASVVVKGIRFGADFDYELQMSHINGLVGGLETVLLPAGQEFGTISSTLIRAMASGGADVSHYLPPVVDAALRRKVIKD